MPMRVAALILGILGGLFGLGAALYGFGIGLFVSAGGAEGPGAVVQVISLASPICAFVGAGVVLRRPATGAVLMILSAFGLWLIFGFGFLTGTSIMLNGLGAIFAFAGDGANSRSRR